MVVDYAADTAAHGAVCLEGIFTPAERVRSGCRWEEVFDGVCNGVQAARESYGVEIRLTSGNPAPVSPGRPAEFRGSAKGSRQLPSRSGTAQANKRPASTRSTFPPAAAAARRSSSKPARL